MIEISMVPAQYADTCWDKVEKFAEKAAKYTYGRFTVDDIYDCVTEQDYQMWVAYDAQKAFKALVVTRIENYPKRKLLAMHFCGGEDMDLWIELMLDMLKKFGKESGCDGIECTGRLGWDKVLKNDGYQGKWMTYELSFGE